MAEYNPYVGPRAFTQAEQRFFFGRPEEIEILTGLVTARRASLLFAQSGAGKSSLLMAGLIPRLTQNRRKVRGRDIVEKLMRDAKVTRVGNGKEEDEPENIYVQSVVSSLSTAEVSRDIAHHTLTRALNAWCGIENRIAPAPLADGGVTSESTESGLPFLLIFDQFEELFTRHPAYRQHREGFFTQVREALETYPDLRVLFSMREDYIAELVPYAHLLPDELRPRFRLERLKLAAAVEAIREPAARGDHPRPFAAGAAEALAQNLQTPHSVDVEPIHLQIVCYQLWKDLPESREQILQEDVDKHGNVDRALTDYYNAAIETVVREVTTKKLSPRRIRRFFTEKLITSNKTRGLVYLEHAGFTRGLPNQVIDILNRSDINILHGEVRGGGRWYELSHDRLIEPILGANARWEAENETTLHRKSRAWDVAGRPDHLLLSRTELQQEELKLKDNPDEPLTVLEEEFLQKSRRAQSLVSVVRYTNIEELGWGIIFTEEKEYASGADLITVDDVREALSELLQHRVRQGEVKFPQSEFTYRANETAQHFLTRYRAGAITVSARKVPYYLLIVGSPEKIPFEFQYALDMNYAVGRLHFEGRTREETLRMFATYARSVVESESGKWSLARKAIIFGPSHSADSATEALREKLLKPLLAELERPELAAEEWDADTVLGGLATKAHLNLVMGGDQTPALLFVASYGLLWKLSDPRQLTEQGAILCADCSDFKCVEREHYLAADDIPDHARLLGLIAFLAASYSAGTPALDNFSFSANERKQTAERPFVSRLCQRLLGHPNGGALAVIGHVDRTRIVSVDERADSPEGYRTFANTLGRLLRGYTVGSAMEFLNVRYSQLASSLVDATLDRTKLSNSGLERLMTETIDIRNYILLGDPAVRLPLEGPLLDQRPMIEPVTIRLRESEINFVAPKQGKVFFNGINVDAGDYFFEPMTIQQFMETNVGEYQSQVDKV
jgi:hypothetical protein